MTSNPDKKLTPLMAQYWEIKSVHMDKILLFRMGDFFEMFHDDAVTAAPILEIALTQRNKKSEDETPMCGVPHHSIAGPINKLLAAGHKVAICDQIEDPKDAKGIVKRAVTRILSPGMVYDPDTLDELSANYLCAFDGQNIGFLETTTGEAFYYPAKDEKERERFLKVLNPKEMVLSSAQEKTFAKPEGVFVSVFEELTAFDDRWPESANRLLSYARHMQGADVLNLIKDFEKREHHQKLDLSATVLRHLEVFENYRGEGKGSLFQAIRRTKTSVGARLLKQWIRFPLMNVSEIQKRQDEIEHWRKNAYALKEVRELLSHLGDIERRLGKLSNPQCHPRDLLALSQSLDIGLTVNQFLPHWDLARGETAKYIDLARALADKIKAVIDEGAPAAMKNGGFIRQGFRADLDELIMLSSDTQKALALLEAKEKESTGISSLKVRYNNVFGYYIEITHTHKNKVPAHYMRKQTLTNAERYVTEELNELEVKVLSAKTRRIELETEIFSELKAEVLQASAQLLNLAKLWSQVDVYTSLAWLSLEWNYGRPVFSEDGSTELKASRHPVIEQELKGKFVPNDVVLKPHQCLLLTGPNMAGKSTLMRQVAIISILAQMGSFVPAEKAVLPIYERIHTRIGASDFLVEGLSTFMVEMTETAEMLRTAGEKSLVVLDEIGRGTSTYDGMSLAQSILEFLTTQSRSTTLFATHYHELTRLEEKFPQIINGHMTIREEKGAIHFLHTLAKGAANRSYGIQVARLAGLPIEVTRRAALILKDLEEGARSAPSAQMSLLDFSGAVEPAFDESAIDPTVERLVDELKKLAIPEVTPLEALNKIARWQQSLS